MLTLILTQMLTQILTQMLTQILIQMLTQISTQILLFGTTVLTLIINTLILNAGIDYILKKRIFCLLASILIYVCLRNSSIKICLFNHYFVGVTNC